jgi:RNA polymerase sigma-70 factor, ECF subfamily
MTTQVPQKTQYMALELDELIVKAQQPGERLALEVLVARVQRQVFATLRQLLPERDDVSDLAQEALLRMCRSIATLRNPKTFKYWLNRILTNLFYDELRKKPRQLNTLSLEQGLDYGDQHEGGASTLDVPDMKAMPDTVALQGELDAKIHEAMRQLPEPFRTTVVLRELQGLNYEEIATLTGCTLGTVKSRLARARGRLQQQLAPYLQQEAL